MKKLTFQVTIWLKINFFVVKLNIFLTKFVAIQKKVLTLRTNSEDLGIDN